MSVKIAFEGTFKIEDNFNFSPNGDKKGIGGELTRIISLDMVLPFNSGTASSTLNAMIITVTRDASHGTEEDLLASAYQFGVGNRGEKMEFKSEIWLIDDTTSDLQNLLGKWEMERTQIMSVQTEDGYDSNPIETIVMHAYEMNYIEGRTNAPLSDDDGVVPLKAKGA